MVPFSERNRWSGLMSYSITYYPNELPDEQYEDCAYYTEQASNNSQSHAFPFH